MLMKVGGSTGIRSTAVHEALSSSQDGATNSGIEFVSIVRSLPGCLTTSVKVETVTKALAGLDAVSPVLKSLLTAMCTKSVDWGKGGQQELVKVLEAYLPSMEAAQQSTERGAVFLESSPRAWGHQEALGTIQRLLVLGHRQEAVRCALHYRLYEHALLLAMMCDTKDAHLAVVSQIVQEQLASTCPLAAAYRNFNELSQPRELPAEEKQSMIAQWTSHAMMAIANFTRDSGETLLQLGDHLLESGNYHDAHVCFLLAQLSPAGRATPQSGEKALQVAEALRSRYLLVGGHYARHMCRATLITPVSVFLTETLEYSRQRENERFVRAQLIPFRIAMAEFYLELGLTQAAEGYQQLLAKLLPTPQPRKDDFVTRNVAEVADAARKKFQQSQQLASSGAGGGGSAKSGGWWPFGGTNRGGSAMPPAPTSPVNQLQPSVTSARASSANPVAPPARSSHSPPPVPPPQASASATAPEPQQPATKSPNNASDVNSAKTGSGWLGKFFGRGGSQQATKKAAEEKEAKEMIIDTEEPPTFDPVTGRWLFKKSAEEEAVERQIQQGPPKMMAAPQTPMQQQGAAGAGFNTMPQTGGPGSHNFIPTGPAPISAPAFGGPPSLPPPAGAPVGPATQRRYVDMFNS